MNGAGQEGAGAFRRMCQMASCISGERFPFPVEKDERYGDVRFIAGRREIHSTCHSSTRLAGNSSRKREGICMKVPPCARQFQRG